MYYIRDFGSLQLAGIDNIVNRLKQFLDVSTWTAIVAYNTETLEYSII